MKKNLTFGIGKKFKRMFNLKNGVNTRVFSYLNRSLKLKNNKTIKNYLKKKPNLKNEIKERVAFLIKLKSFKGLRHILRYPARGQRTHTNAKTRKKFTY
jgi:small subunit ribosomal protein S13